MAHIREPVPHTCPDIDKVQKAIERSEKLCRHDNARDDEESLRSRLDDIAYELYGLIGELEKLRKANASLREWGTEEAGEVDALHDELRSIEKQVAKD
jgi:hypothetical protein